MCGSTWVTRSLLGFVRLVFVVLPLVSGTPFPFPGRPLQSRHKQMRVVSNAGVQTEGQLSAATATAKPTFTVRLLLCFLSFCVF